MIPASTKIFDFGVSTNKQDLPTSLAPPKKVNLILFLSTSLCSKIFLPILIQKLFLKSTSSCIIFLIPSTTLESIKGALSIFGCQKFLL